MAKGLTTFDRSPPNLIHRLLERYEPFRGHHMIHLGVIARQNFWRVLLVGARIVGAHAIRKELDAVPSARAAFNEQIEAHADLTAEAGIQKPGEALSQAAAQLQKRIDLFFSPAHLVFPAPLSPG